MAPDLNEETTRTDDRADPRQRTGRSSISAAGGTRATRSRQRAKKVRWRDIIGPAGWIKIVILGGLLLWLYKPQVHRIVYAWINDPNWSHGFLIPLFSLYFLHQRRDRLLRVSAANSRLNWLGLVVIIVCIGVCLVSIYPLKMGYPQLLAVLGTLFGIVWLCCSWRVMLITWLPTLYLFFAIPLPRRIYERLTIPLRKLASESAAMALSLIPGLEAEARGVIIDGLYNGKSFELSVAEACAGMRLMMAFLALAVAMAYLSDRPYWHRIILVLSAVPIAIFCNFVRVTLTGVIYVLIDPALATGGFHTTLGLLMLPLAFLIYWGIAGVLNNLYIEEPVSDRA